MVTVTDIGRSRHSSVLETSLGGDLGLILEAERRSPDQPVLESLLACAAGIGDGLRRREVTTTALAAERLLRRSAPWALSIESSLLSLLTAVGDAHDRLIFLETELALAGRTSMPALAARLGVTATRVAQRRDRAARQVRAAYEQVCPPARWAVQAFRLVAGRAVPQREAGDLAERLGLGASWGDEGRTASRALQMLLWLAGRYRPDARVEGWLVSGEGDLVVSTQRLLRQDGGVSELDVIEAALIAERVAAELVVPWVGACGGSVVDGHSCAWVASGSLYDAIERLVEARGAPLSPAECTGLLRSGGRPASEEDIEQALKARRFREAAEGGYELRSWRGGHRPGHGADQCLPPSGEKGRVSKGRASKGRASTVTGPAQPVAVPDFAPTDHERSLLQQLGLLEDLDRGPVTSDGEPPGAGALAGWRQVPPQAPATVYPVEARPDGRTWFSVDVSDALLDGAESPAPEHLIQALGVGWHQRRTFASRYGPVIVANDGPEPTHSSLRPLVLGSGAEVGDVLWLGFGEDGDLVVTPQLADAAGQASEQRSEHP